MFQGLRPALTNKEKLYIVPCSFVDENTGFSLFKSGNAEKLNNRNYYFRSIKIISNFSKNEEILSIKEFKNNFLKKNKRLKKMYDNIILEKKLYVKNKNILKNKDYVIFGILNVTPDSFSDGGMFNNEMLSLSHAKKMLSEGADFIDVGGESTRPGAKKVNEKDEILRVLPVIQNLSKANINISLDTRNSSTMYICNFCGVCIINDVSALRDKNSLEIVKNNNLSVILMHMPGTPKTMMKKKYKNVLLDTYDFLNKRIEYCERNGLSKERIIVDPGIGFGKNKGENIDLIKNISIFHSLGCAIMLGVSRKKLISNFGSPNLPNERIGGSLSFALHSFNQGVEIFRVHDVKETSQALQAWKYAGEK